MSEPDGGFITTIICPKCGRETKANVPPRPDGRSKDWVYSWSKCYHCGTNIKITRHYSGIWQIEK